MLPFFIIYLGWCPAWPASTQGSKAPGDGSIKGLAKAARRRARSSIFALQTHKASGAGVNPSILRSKPRKTLMRSEERRVGKERRYRRGTKEEKKKGKKSK